MKGESKCNSCLISRGLDGELGVHLKTFPLKILAILFAASSISATAQPMTAPPASRFIESECDNSQRINVRFAADSATVLYRGQLATLRQQPSGSGYRYADANWVLMGKGTVSTLETVSGAKLAVNCEGGAVVNGTVTYLPKIALPATAIVTVRLEEVSRADAPSTLLATVNVPTQGQQVPIQWGFVYDPNWLEPNGRYVVRATISDSGRLIWTSDTAISLPPGGSDQLEINVVQVAQAPSVNLRGTNWELTSLTVGGVQTRVMTKPRPTLAFDGARMSGNSGCNGFGGSYTQNVNRLQIGTVISTLRACADDNMMKLEAMYFRALSGTVQFTSDASSLTLTYVNGDVLVFTRAAAAQVVVAQPNSSLSGSSWNLSAYSLGSQSVTVPNNPPTVDFDAAGRVTGFSGCNRFTGGFSSPNAGALKFTPLASTRMMCMGVANTLETAFLKILQGATRYSRDATTLKIFSSAGTLTFKRSR